MDENDSEHSDSSQSDDSSPPREVPRTEPTGFCLGPKSTKVSFCACVREYRQSTILDDKGGVHLAIGKNKPIGILSEYGAAVKHRKKAVPRSKKKRRYAYKW